MTITEKLAKLIGETIFADFPQKAIEEAENHCMDIAGVTLAGSLQPLGIIITNLAREMAGREESGVIGGRFRTSAPDAAFANGTIGHVLDYDDVGLIGHPSITIVPVILALGEKLELSGKDILESYIVGIETEGRLRKAAYYHQHDRGFHSTPLFGIMGGVAAASKLLQLDTLQICRALGIAASGTSGVQANVGFMAKSFGPGNACRVAIWAALLAREGFTANENIFESNLGYGDVFIGRGKLNAEKITYGWGNPFLIVSPGLAIKKYPTCYRNHKALDAILGLIEQNNIDYQNVAEVLLETPLKSPMFFHEPKTALQAKFSMEYNMAVAMLDKKVTITSFSDERALSPDFIEVEQKVKVVEHPEWRRRDEETGDYIQRGDRVTIKLRSGQSFSSEVDNPTGHWMRPLPGDYLLTKYLENARTVLSSERAKRSAELWQNLESVTNIAELMDLITFTE
jgi:2-methylcitrate dehydratase PrpD